MTKPKPARRVPSTTLPEMEKLLTRSQEPLGGPGSALDGPTARAQRLMARAIYDALLDGCECSACRALGKVARLTRQATQADLDDAED